MVTKILFALGAGLSAGTAALIKAGGAVAGAGLSAGATAGRNKKQRRWQNEQWHKRSKQYWDSWQANNNYNHPREQMKRLKQAGLNPNLVYGNGGQTGGTAQSASMPSSQNANFETVPTGNFQGIADYGMSRLQANQTQAQIELIKAQTLNTMSKTDTSDYNLEELKAFEGHRRDLMGYTVDTARDTAGITSQKHSQEINNTFQSEMDAIDRYTHDPQEKANELHEMKKEIHDENLKLIKAQTSNANKDAAIKQFEIEYEQLWKDNIGGGKGSQKAFFMGLTHLLNKLSK